MPKGSKRPNRSRPSGGEGKPMSQEDRFWRVARRMLRQGRFNDPFAWMNSDDGAEAAQESQEDYYDALEDQQAQNPYGTPGGGQYIGDESAIGQPQGSPYAQPQMTEQLTPESLFPPGVGPQAVPSAGGGSADLLLQGMPQGAPQAPTAAPTSFQGAPQDQVALAMKYGQQYGVDPGVLLAIAKHETGFGKLGLGRKGLTLGYGAYDSGPTMKWAGPENQYRGAAGTLSKWGVRGIEDILGGKAASYATDPGWENAVASAYKGLAPQLESSPTDSPPPAEPKPPSSSEPEEGDDEDEEDED